MCGLRCPLRRAPIGPETMSSPWFAAARFASLAGRLVFVRPDRPFTTHRTNLAATTYPFLLDVRCVTTKGGARDSDFVKAVSRRDPGQGRLARLHSTCKIADLARSKEDAARGRAAMLLPHGAAGAAGAVVRRSRREARTVPVSMPAGGENRPPLFPR